jgi:hypothetical protein
MYHDGKWDIVHVEQPRPQYVHPYLLCQTVDFVVHSLAGLDLTHRNGLMFPIYLTGADHCSHQLMATASAGSGADHDQR